MTAKRRARKQNRTPVLDSGALHFAKARDLTHRHLNIQVVVFIYLVELQTNQKDKTMTQTNTFIECLECAADVPLPADVMENEIISCPDCGTELEVMSINPLEVDFAPEVEEDWGE